MWKRYAIRVAWLYLDKLFLKWMAHQDQSTRNSIAALIFSFESYLRKKDRKTTTLIADLLSLWRE